MNEYEKHIKDQRASNLDGIAVSYCGEELNEFPFHFLGATHAIATIQEGSRLAPCKKCKNKLIEILRK